MSDHPIGYTPERVDFCAHWLRHARTGKLVIDECNATHIEGRYENGGVTVSFRAFMDCWCFDYFEWIAIDDVEPWGKGDDPIPDDTLWVADAGAYESVRDEIQAKFEEIMGTPDALRKFREGMAAHARFVDRVGLATAAALTIAEVALRGMAGALERLRNPPPEPEPDGEHTHTTIVSNFTDREIKR